MAYSALQHICCRALNNSLLDHAQYSVGLRICLTTLLRGLQIAGNHNSQILLCVCSVFNHWSSPYGRIVDTMAMNCKPHTALTLTVYRSINLTLIVANWQLFLLRIPLCFTNEVYLFLFCCQILQIASLTVTKLCHIFVGDQKLQMSVNKFRSAFLKNCSCKASVFCVILDK